LDVICASITYHTLKATNVLVWKDLEIAYRDTIVTERVLQKIQVLTQKKDLKIYIHEFNTLQGLTQETVAMSDSVVLCYFTQELVKNFCIAIAVTAFKDLATVQVDI
jgi:hypothetical protein